MCRRAAREWVIWVAAIFGASSLAAADSRRNGICWLPPSGRPALRWSSQRRGKHRRLAGRDRVVDPRSGADGRASQGKDAAAQDAASKMLTTSTGTGVAARDIGAIAPRAGGGGTHRGGSGSKPERAGDRDAQPGPSRWSAASEPGEDGVRVNAICPGGMHRVTAILLACVMNTPRPTTMTARSGASRPCPPRSRGCRRRRPRVAGTVPGG